MFQIALLTDGLTKHHYVRLVYINQFLLFLGGQTRKYRMATVKKLIFLFIFAVFVIALHSAILSAETTTECMSKCQQAQQNCLGENPNTTTRTLCSDLYGICIQNCNRFSVN